MAPILLVTKLHPPFVPAETVTRERLFAQLNERRRLTLVACPAGFGKSTLLAAWRESNTRPVAWVTLDEGDDDAAGVTPARSSSTGRARRSSKGPARRGDPLSRGRSAGRITCAAISTRPSGG